MRRGTQVACLLVLGLGVAWTLRLHARPDHGDGEDKVCRDDSDHHDHNLRTPLKLIGVVPVPGNPIVSADIAWVDPGTERYYLADRSNSGVDIINVETGFYEARVGGMVGVVGPQDGTTINNSSGPNGVLVTPNRRLWVGDGNSTLRVADVDPDSPNYLSILHSVNTSVTDPSSPSFCDNGTANGHWCGRADELGYDPKDHVILIANNGPFSPTHVDPILCPNGPHNHCPVEPYATLVSANPPYSILKVFSFANAGGLEQPVWDPGLSRFWLTVPGVGPTGSPQIARIDPKTKAVDKTITINCTAPPPAGLGLPTNNASTTGIALAPFQHLLVAACGFPVDVNAISGSAKLITTQVGGGDEVWYNSGDGRFYVTGRDAKNVQQLGVIDAQHDTLLQSIPVSTGSLPPTGTTLTSGRNPSAFSEANRVFVDAPVTAAIVAGTKPDDSLCTKFGVVGRGCIAVFAHTGEGGDGDDDH
jgi:hypothetical protein